MAEGRKKWDVNRVQKVVAPRTQAIGAHTHIKMLQERNRMRKRLHMSSELEREKLIEREKQFSTYFAGANAEKKSEKNAPVIVTRIKTEDSVNDSQSRRERKKWGSALSESKAEKTREKTVNSGEEKQEQEQEKNDFEEYEDDFEDFESYSGSEDSEELHNLVRWGEFHFFLFVCLFDSHWIK